MLRALLAVSLLFATAVAASSAPTAADHPGSSSAASGSVLDAGRIDRVLAATHAAAGGARLDQFAAVTESGTAEQGGPPFPITALTNLRNGYSRARTVVGPATFLQGYDGAEWTQQNGILSIVSLPSVVADAVTQAYLSSNAYFRRNERSTVLSGRVATIGGRQAYVLHVEPAGGSPADLAFDASTYRLVQVLAQTSSGPDATTNSDFRTIQGIPTSLRSVDVNSSGTTTTTTLMSVRYTTAFDPGAFARPPYVSHGVLAAPASVPFVSDVAGAVGHVVVPVDLDGKRVTLDFDSGGANFLIPEAAQRLGLNASGGIASGGAGAKQQTTAFAAVPSVDFGGARLAKQNFIVTSLPYTFAHPRKGVAPEGLIGFEYLANFRVAFRYADGRIDVAPFDAAAPSGGTTLPFKSDGEHAYVLASVDGVSGYFLLDTGNGGGIDLNEPFVEQHHLFPSGGLPYKSPGGVGGGLTLTVATARTFQLAGLTFDNVPVGIPQVKSGFFATRGVAGNLGAGILSRFTVVFDFKAQTATFIPNANATAQFPSDRTGLSLDQTGPDAFEVLDVVPGSPAANAGIATGDRITAVTGTPVTSGLGLGDSRSYLSGNAPFAVTTERAGTSKTVTLTPRDLLPPAQ